ncbi:MBL fold metallo-hydrolase [Sphingomonas panacis]|uniref:MBL fold metallo-hydrolase n=2 Tax=Sphingomonas panacis TaxID=1560345 RepID=A0A1B3ZGE5_9SPHN|nr:MBL fold metallo-hydrolase [Sphingomonas panacis]
MTWEIGDVTVTKIVEVEMSLGGEFLFDERVSVEELQKIGWLAPHFIDENGLLKISVHALIVDTPTKRILVDTCIGNDKEREIPIFANLQTKFLQDLEGAGFPRDSIDCVLCTHLHIDHVGWNTMLVDGKWVPTFPNSRYLFGKAEFEFWKQNDVDNADGHIDQKMTFKDSVQPIWEAGLVDLVDLHEQICEEVSLEPTLGHTPGHVSVRIRSNGEDALITGDFTHHPCQIAHPDWNSHVDYDAIQSTETRRAKYAELADTGTLVIGTHYATPTAGHIVRDADGYRLKVD